MNQDNLDLDALEDPEPIGGLSSEQSVTGEDIDPDDIPDPEPIPGVFGAADDADEGEEAGGKRSRKGLIFICVLIVLLAGVSTGAAIMREMVVTYWSGANDIFSLVGLRVPQLGDGLDLRYKEPRRDGKEEDKLIIDLIVENISDESKNVPDVITKAVDANGAVVQTISTPPPKRTLKPGETIRFKGVFEKVVPTAKKVSKPGWGDIPVSGKPEKKKN